MKVDEGSEDLWRAAPPLVLVTGMSGAGNSTAIRALEDLGFEAIDNLPLAYIPQIATPRDGARRPLAIGVDSRTRGFSAEGLATLVSELRRDARVAPPRRPRRGSKRRGPSRRNPRGRTPSRKSRRKISITRCGVSSAATRAAA